ncbi:hypothetical protein EFO64_02435 [Limosilactobacillus reuteri]|uniref:Uncharacterized protein n=3 Tax=Limosilactobacillus reuteri TaxID=1598 RepID=A0ABD6Y8K1_LIMRT|nr:hypothetical protein [Limosilactobacillus reuteri]MCT3200950.1 hypothetical protein [Limosilactobacillus reuteri]MCT3202682.1 hypothetical protein [Limosilactobacillus reuteri]MCT3212614.1 hypothetical protein [Limosilactobacillus reuteri]PWT38271.1 hypothetical protein DKZ35_01180 [Limosilactobacillus reuteri]PWT42076.1 hypothetical protein DKZ34_00925 [Limosilactobacillus reuteri]
MLTKLIASLITVGGMGFMNFLVTDQLGTVDLRHDHKTEMIAYSLLWSIFDFAIFLMINSLLQHYCKLSGNWLIVYSLIFTLVLAFLITLLIARPLNGFVYFCYNRVASGQIKKANFIPGSTFTNKLNNDKKAIVYLYDFDHNPINFGILDEYSLDDTGQPQISLVPGMQRIQPTYQNLIDYISKDKIYEQYQPFSYINFEQKWIMFVLQG